MKLTVNAVHFNADQSLMDFIQKKLNKLETFYDRIIDGDVYLRLEKGEKTKVQKKLIEVKLNVPGNSIFVKEEGSSFEEATDLALDVLTRKVKRFKQKLNDHNRSKSEMPVNSTEEVLEDEL
ncbi:ribosome-associated translation inhibitor RaiA [Marinilongibacter aquaticus]|uniref:ribosome hibernation-promoting factor, HPF/YfiA family n=1 Tax=Marinilongibacter aquaticus TaxID=2975157 RepID=UPI0021BD67A8|nr:ribosome-associated translation inhibitor RaiA [Marinilongibacter aquaticus]UBM58321.1 ribosome-associated translation inhibitor RaiA [Marinilongibacter aquaticus]